MGLFPLFEEVLCCALRESALLLGYFQVHLPVRGEFYLCPLFRGEGQTGRKVTHELIQAVILRAGRPYEHHARIGFLVNGNCYLHGCAGEIDLVLQPIDISHAGDGCNPSLLLQERLPLLPGCLAVALSRQLQLKSFVIVQLSPAFL